MATCQTPARFFRKYKLEKTLNPAHSEISNTPLTNKRHVLKYDGAPIGVFTSKEKAKDFMREHARPRYIEWKRKYGDLY